jgi:uncharacterized protein (TIGR03435 family)
MGMKKFFLFSLGAALAMGTLLAQTPAGTSAPSPAKVEFEVASIKTAVPIQTQVMSGKMHIGMTVDAGRVDFGGLSLADLIPIAFKVKAYQVSGPSWMSSDRFDITAKIPEGVSKEQIPEMLQALLVDRFKMTFHKEGKEQAIYELVVGKGGPKMKESEPEPATPPAAEPAKGPAAITVGGADGSQVRVTPTTNGATVSGVGGMGKMRVTPGTDGTMRMEASGVKMAALAEMLTRFTDKPVFDKTGLTGSYDISLELSIAELMATARAAGMMPPGAGMGRGGMPAGAGSSAPATASDPSGGGSVFQSVQQLGLKLEPKRQMNDVIVIDHLEKAPTEN